ncbi:sigma-70 family RNA polymerase sigma factor [Saccharothrix sp. NRRL B-16348]|uniref:sigma-70 family RNA polymerase sigma factor n=1 Tax=Saccharothrix sp. NRRL B-16348 TaxID=1415542 RepID=UPI000A5C495F|nr:sigma-70 family RNA polymerase sigma factor [Saccharothrix sp. NRRL B-16348]
MNEAELPEAPVGSATPADVPNQLGPGQAVPGQLGPGQAVPARASVGPGREIAFTDFYRATTPSLIAFLVWQGARLADAADVAQETMATAYRRWHDLDNPRAWAFRVASRALIRRLTSTREEPFAEPPEPSPLVRATAIEHWEQHHDIARAVTRLPPRQRQVMAWTLAGSTPAEIAAELGLKAETVRSTLLKARRALAKELHGAGGGQ